jgi:hypothetical protein
MSSESDAAVSKTVVEEGKPIGWDRLQVVLPLDNESHGSGMCRGIWV